MFETFQSFPAWILNVFLGVWLAGCLFYLIKKWKFHKSISPTEDHKEKISIRSISFAISLFILFMTLDWTKHTLLSGLDGIHSGLIAGIYLVLVFYICIVATNLFWNLLKIIFRIYAKPQH